MTRFSTRFASFLLALCAALVGCDADPTVPRDASAPMQTDALLYKVRETEWGYETRRAIGYVFTNELSTSVYVANCHRLVPPSLQKLEGGTWVAAWSAAVPLCKSPPIVIPGGQIYEDSLSVWGCVRGSTRCFPQFQAEGITGVYRLVWHGVSTSPSGGDEIPLEQRVSNQFVLSLE